jgi:hypothetical protein
LYNDWKETNKEKNSCYLLNNRYIFSYGKIV